MVSYAQDLRELLTAGTIRPGVVAVYTIPPELTWCRTPIELIPDPDTDGVMIEIINEAVLTSHRRPLQGAAR